MNAKAELPTETESEPVRSGDEGPRRAVKTSIPITRGDTLAERLAEDITAGHFAPGSRLDEVRLAARYGTSRTPVREALRQLEATGLVERRPYRGAIVSSPTRELLMEMSVAAGELEASCARLAATAMSHAERRELRQAQAHMSELADAGQVEAYLAADAAFHELISEGAHNSAIAGFARDLRRRLRPFHRLVHDSGALAKMHAEHEDLVAAIEGGKGDVASDLMRRHMQEASQGKASGPTS